MGYRSEVVLYVRHPEARARLLMHSINNELLLSTIAEAADNVNDDYILLQWDSIKWYDDYPEIADIERYVDECIELVDEMENPGNCAVALANIGEDDDVGIRGTGEYYDVVRINREIEINV